MPDKTSNHIELQSFDLYNRIEQIHHSPKASADNIQAKYILLYKVLQQACYELTADATIAFANLFARLDFICKERKMTPSDKYAIQTMRRNCNAAMGDNFVADVNEYRYDLRALVRFISLAYEEDIPASLLPEIPHSNRPYSGTKKSLIEYLRVSVSSWDDTRIFAATDSDEDPLIIIDYAKAGINGDQLYLHDLLKEDMQLNLLDTRVDENNVYIPNLIVVQPDYLIDISSLAACFREYGHHPFNFFINKIKPRVSTSPILMGNLAGQFLDDYINTPLADAVLYKHSIKKFFAQSALEFCTCPEIDGRFHEQAQMQMMNIKHFIHEVFPNNIHAFNPKSTLLEASFICEKLGLQGRVDMLQKDFKVLVEQKSGKRDEYRRRHKEDHFVQMMLYQGILMYNFGQKTEDMQTFLLYSKYHDGLVIEHFAEELFRQSIALRNRIVVNETALAEGAIGNVSDSLSSEILNEFAVQNKLWTDYQEPQLQEVISTLKHCSPTEKAYFRRFFTFISKEQLLAKTGGRNDPSNGFASLWHTPLPEKIEAGNILLGLTITEKRRSSPDKGYDIIKLHIPQQGEDFLPNFRSGDIIILYSYTGMPDVRNEILMKGNIIDITTDEVMVLLRNGQQNKDIIGTETDLFAIEHDSSDTSSVNAMRGLFTLLTGRRDRKELLLGLREPETDASLTLNGDYGRFNTQVLKAKQAKDYFMLVGPPGTGKTSCALRYMVEEALTEDDTSILLLSYTNRAVDEICRMLVDSGIAARTPFIRIGNELSCDELFRTYLLKNLLTENIHLNELRSKLTKTRIYVGTTTAINSRLYLFSLKHFNVAMIDEASQILEPDLMGILSARHGQYNAIDKFILIGDYKQLPAIAMQSAEEAEVTDPLLTAIGLTDCRNSLFERLYKNSPQEVRSILNKQGRMHPAIAEFPNNAFYHDEHLESVPLPHQEEELPYPIYRAPLHNENNIDRLLTTRRMAFIATSRPNDENTSDKSNREEAKIVATLIEHIYHVSSIAFSPLRTVGVIVPYRNQIAMIREEISHKNIPRKNLISIDTVERYQGSQRDVIIYSFTISSIGQLNFLTANTFREGDFMIDRKLNVAITRARKQLILVGNPHILGADLTFYKLMEYIRMNNGYIDTTANEFAREKFSVPQYAANWDVKPQCYQLPEAFSALFRQYIANETEKRFPTVTTNNAPLRETIGYGRYDFGNTGNSSLFSATDKLYLYNYFYMRRSYTAARSLFETIGGWLTSAASNVSGKVVFCDVSYECGASGLAFIDMIQRRMPHSDVMYAGIYPTEEMDRMAYNFFSSEPYSKVSSCFYPRIGAIQTEFWKAHSVLSELIIFNMSNLFDRIQPIEARHLALQINQLVQAYPLNHYAIIYRDDAGQRTNDHSYKAFRTHLHHSLKPINEQMPLEGKYYLNPEKDEALPDSGTYNYEVISNR